MAVNRKYDDKMKDVMSSINGKRYQDTSSLLQDALKLTSDDQETMTAATLLYNCYMSQGDYYKSLRKTGEAAKNYELARNAARDYNLGVRNVLQANIEFRRMSNELVADQQRS